MTPHRCLSAVAVLLGASIAATAADWPDGELTLALSQAIVPSAAGSASTNATPPADLVVTVVRRDGGWRRDVYGHAPALGGAEHFGRLMEIAAESNVVRLALHMQINAPGYESRAEAFYAVSLKRDGDTFTGEHRGRVGSRPCRGAVRAEPRPATPVLAGFVPPAVGEHPRLLFRTNALDALRRYALTDAGQATLQKVRSLTHDPLASALLYALTGDAAFADRAAPTPGPADAATCLTRALAFDVVAPALAAHRRANAATSLQWHGMGLLDSYSRSAHGTPDSLAWLAAAYAAFAATWDATPSGAVEPAPPLARSIPAPLDVPMDEALPATLLRPGLTPPRWLYVGPFAVRPDRDDALTYRDGDAARSGAFVAGGLDFLSDLGGVAAARPTAGLPVRFGGRARVFAPLPRDAIRITDDGIEIVPAAVLGGHPCAVGYFYCVVRSPRESWYQLLLASPRHEAQMGTHAPPDWMEATAYLNGVAVRHADLVRLGTGPYPLMIRAASEGENPTLAPRFVSLTDTEAQREAQAREVRFTIERRACRSCGDPRAAYPWLAIADRQARRALMPPGVGWAAARPEALAAAQRLALAFRNSAGVERAPEVLRLPPADPVVAFVLEATGDRPDANGTR